MSMPGWMGSADAELKGSYKFPHHYKDGGPAILAGVNNAKARLSQASIPKADVAGVEATFLNAHQNDVKQAIQTMEIPISKNDMFEVFWGAMTKAYQRLFHQRN